jgi:hypothetical protein
MNEPSLAYAPSRTCPGCHAELSVGDATLEHLNRCAALRGMIASGSGYIVRNTETVSGKKALHGSDPQSNIGEKAATRRSDWKVHGPVVNALVEKNTTSTKMKLPVPIKEKTVKPSFRKPYPIDSYCPSLGPLSQRLIRSRLKHQPNMSMLVCGSSQSTQVEVPHFVMYHAMYHTV